MSFEKGADDATHFDGQSQLWLMVNENQRDLWDRIERFQVDDPSKVAFPFVVRLARENGWSREFAQRVFEEYKRFAFLCLVAGHHCTPSDEVDQAWHLHLTYTRSYWEEFCGRILPKPLHHDPTKGGEDESDKFEDWYARTKESYRAYFGHDAPEDIWPPAAVRFSQDARFVRVDAARHWILSKRKPRLLGWTAGLVAMGLLGVGCAQDESQYMSIFSVVLLILGFMVLIGVLVKYGGKGNGSGGGCSSGASCGSSCGSGCGSGCGGGCGGGGCGS
jgi:hypothetical protein